MSVWYPFRNLKWIKQYSSIVSEVNYLEKKEHAKIQKTYNQFIDVQQYKMHYVLPTVRIDIGECMYHWETDHTAFHRSITFSVGWLLDLPPDIIFSCKRQINHFFLIKTTIKYETMAYLMSMIIVIHL